MVRLDDLNEFYAWDRSSDHQLLSSVNTFNAVCILSLNFFSYRTLKAHTLLLGVLMAGAMHCVYI